MAQLNFNLLNPPGSENIANAFVKGMDQSRAQRRDEQALRMQEAQMQQSLRQGRMEEMKYEKLRRDEEALNNFYQNAIKNGAPENPKLMAKMMMESGVPEIVKTGIALHTKQLEVEEARRQAELDMYGPGGAPTAAPTAAPAAAPVAAPGDLLGLGNQLMPTNALAASAPAAPVANALVAPSAPAASQDADRLAQIRRAQSKLISNNEGVRKAGEIELKALTEPQRMYVVDGNLVDANGKPAFTATPKPPAPPEIVRLYDDLEKTTDPAKRRAIEARISKLTSHAPPSQTITNVQNYAPASVAAQTEYMKAARATFDTLKQAPSALENIERAKELVPSAKSFMGPGGEPLLQAASFFNNRLGTSIDVKGITDATELRSRLFQGILENLKKLDAQPTQKQQDALREALGSLGTDPNALPRVLDSFADTIRNKVDTYNKEVADAERRGIKFPYNPIIELPSRGSPKPSGAAKPAAPAASTGGVIDFRSLK